MGALAWVANLAADAGRPMTAGMVVITGSVVPTIDIGARRAARLRARGRGRSGDDWGLAERAA